MMAHRWVCPICGAGANLGSRPRKNATARYCLPCSKRTGSLVERTCPVLDAQRKRGTDAAKARARAKRDRDRARDVVHGVDLQAECARLWKIGIDLGFAEGERPALTVRRGKKSHASGRAYWPSHRIVLTVGKAPRADVLEVLAHEVAHHLTPDDEQTHGDAFYARLCELVAAAYGVDVFDEIRATTRAWAKDAAIRDAMRKAGA